MDSLRATLPPVINHPSRIRVRPPQLGLEQRLDVLVLVRCDADGDATSRPLVLLAVVAQLQRGRHRRVVDDGEGAELGGGLFEELFDAAPLPEGLLGKLHEMGLGV